MKSRNQQTHDQEIALLKQQLDESRRQFETLFQALPNPMIITTVKDGRIIAVNRAHAKLSLFHADELIGRTTLDMDFWVDPRQREMFIREFKENGRVHNMEMEARTKFGDIQTILLSADRITVNGEECMVGVSTDITQQKRKTDALRESEEALRKSKEYLNQIINCIGDPIFVKDRSHRLVLANDAFCTFVGGKREDLLGTTGHNSNLGDLPRKLWSQEEEVLNTGKESLTEEQIPDPRDGSIRTVLSKKTRLHDRHGNTLVVGVLRDITDYKRMEMQFLQSQKMEAIGALAGGIAHDFNNLLLVINGYVELLLDRPDLDAQCREDIIQIGKASRQAAAVTSQLLAFSRRQMMKPELLNLNSIFADMDNMLRRLIGEDVEIQTSYEPGLDLVNADPGQIQQVMMNLAANARDAMPTGGRLTITTRNLEIERDLPAENATVKPGSYVVVEVADTGTGMDSRTRDRIFEPFFTTKGKGKGTGLGLSTVYGIVSQSGGCISVDSRPGEGTSFTIYFPRAAAGEARPAAVNALSPSLVGSENILLVEDEPNVRYLASRILREWGYLVLEAADGLEAVRIAREFDGPIHLVLTDVVMPGIPVTGMMEEIQSIRPGIKSIYCSGYTDDSIVRRGFMDSGVRFLQKPYEVERLLQIVRQTLES